MNRRGCRNPAIRKAWLGRTVSTTLHGTAVLLLATATPAVQAYTYCVQTAAQLRTALADAGNGGAHNGQANVVHIRSGEFTAVGVPFFFGTTSGADLTIDGGWNNTCSLQNSDPTSTVLDGGGMNQVLSIGTNGDLTIAHLTISHGSLAGPGGGATLALNGFYATAIVIFSGNIVRDNTSTAGVGAGVAIAGNGTVIVENSLFTGNNGTSAAALSINLTLGTAYLTNNTITDNTDSTYGSSITWIGSSTANGYVSNTISYANQGPNIKDFHLDGIAKIQFVHSDYATIDGTAAAGSGNFINVDPKFVAADDHHLQDVSPLLRAGTPTPMGGLPSSDLDGNSRVTNGQVDLGAYQNVSFIFADGFEQP